MKSPTIRTVTYLRAGRLLRASGDVIETDNGMTKVWPHHPGWGAVWLTASEIAAGNEKPALKPRQRQVDPDRAPKAKRAPKPLPPPAWRVLVDRVRLFETDHHPKGWPAVRMEFLTRLADELEAARRELAGFLPLNSQNAEAIRPADKPTPTNQ